MWQAEVVSPGCGAVDRPGGPALNPPNRAPKAVAGGPFKDWQTNPGAGGDRDGTSSGAPRRKIHPDQGECWRRLIGEVKARQLISLHCPWQDCRGSRTKAGQLAVSLTKSLPASAPIDDFVIPISKNVRAGRSVR